MLDESSYVTAIYLYVGSAVVLLIYLAWWLRKHCSSSWVSLVVLLLASLLLTPAYPKAAVDTMAPALIVAVFELLTVGAEGTSEALRPIIFMAGVAVVLALLLRITVFRRHKK
ncbi:MAG: hypothetical protein P8J79_12445 [Halioglobus sp.]|nr:hypothetical protein [Halioglobus sp.]